MMVWGDPKEGDTRALRWRRPRLFFPGEVRIEAGLPHTP